MKGVKEPVPPGELVRSLTAKVTFAGFFLFENALLWTRHKPDKHFDTGCPWISLTIDGGLNVEEEKREERTRLEINFSL